MKRDLMKNNLGKNAIMVKLTYLVSKKLKPVRFKNV